MRDTEHIIKELNDGNEIEAVVSNGQASVTIQVRKLAEDDTYRAVKMINFHIDGAQNFNQSQLEYVILAAENWEVI